MGMLDTRYVGFQSGERRPSRFDQILLACALVGMAFLALGFLLASKIVIAIGFILVVGSLIIAGNFGSRTDSPTEPGPEYPNALH